MKECEEPKIGGNALKKTFTRRHDRDEYFIKEAEVIRVIKDRTYFKPSAIPAYKTKETFGDMDILYTHPKGAMDVSLVQSLFKPNEIIKNGSVISFDYKEIQVDLIFAPEDEFLYSLGYFSWNDTGNFLGRLAKKFDLKHGHTGLYLPVKDGDYGIAEILVTKDHSETLRFLGLPVEKFDAGFDTLEDIFEYIASSPVFNPEIYLFENRNASGRIRDKKRASYNALLKWCADNDAQLHHNPHIKKWEGRERVFQYFGEHIREQYQAALAKVAYNRAVKEKFNGDLVNVLTKLQGKELGEFMIKLKAHSFFKSENLFSAGDFDIHEKIIEVYNEFIHRS